MIRRMTRRWWKKESVTIRTIVNRGERVFLVPRVTLEEIAVVVASLSFPHPSHLSPHTYTHARTHTAWSPLLIFTFNDRPTATRGSRGSWECGNTNHPPCENYLTLSSSCRKRMTKKEAKKKKMMMTKTMTSGEEGRRWYFIVQLPSTGKCDCISNMYVFCIDLFIGGPTL